MSRTASTLTEITEAVNAPQRLEDDILSDCDCTTEGRGLLCSIDHWSDAD